MALEMYETTPGNLVDAFCDLCGPQQAIADTTAPDAMGSWVVCLQCGLVYKHPRPSFPTILDRSMGARSTAPDRDTLSKMELLALERYRVLRQWLGLAGNGTPRVFEVGCGAGCFLRLLQGAGWVVHGVEPDACISEYGRETYSLDIETSPAELLEPPADQLDLAASFQGLNRVASPHLVLSKLAESLREEGLLFLETPCLDRSPTLAVDDVLGSEATQAFSCAWLCGLLDRLGMRVFAAGLRESHLWIVARKTGTAARLDIPMVLDDPVARFHSLRIALLRPEARRTIVPFPEPAVPPRAEVRRTHVPMKPLPSIGEVNRPNTVRDSELRVPWPARQARRLIYKIRNERQDLLSGLVRKVLRRVGLSPEWEPRYRPPKGRPRLAIITGTAQEIADEPIYQACLRWAVEKSYGPVHWTEARSAEAFEKADTLSDDSSGMVHLFTGRSPSHLGANDAPHGLSEIVRAAVSRSPVVAFGVGVDGTPEHADLLESALDPRHHPNVQLLATWHRPESAPGYRRGPIRVRRRLTWQPPLPAVCGLCAPNGLSLSGPESQILLISVPMEQTRTLLGSRAHSFLRAIALAARTLYERGWGVTVAHHAPLDASFEAWLDGADVPYEVRCRPAAEVSTVLATYAQALLVVGCRPLTPALGIGLGRAFLGLDIGNGVSSMLNALGAGDSCLYAADQELSERIVHIAGEVERDPYAALAGAAALRERAWDATLANLARLLDVVEETDRWRQ